MPLVHKAEHQGNCAHQNKADGPGRIQSENTIRLQHGAHGASANQDGRF